MRLVLGPPPNTISESEVVEGKWRRLAQPPLWALHLISLPLGIAVGLVMLSAWVAFTPRFTVGDGPLSPVVPITLLVLLAGPLFQLTAHPHLGFSAKSLLGLWPSRVTIYTSYSGKLAKSRYVLQLVLPFLLLSVVPLVAVVIIQVQSGWLVFVSCSAALVYGTNGVLALAAAIQLPAGSVVAGRGFATYWCRSATDG
jgi:hypothetical protein